MVVCLQPFSSFVLDDTQQLIFEQQKKFFFLFCSNIFYFHIFLFVFPLHFHIIRTPKGGYFSHFSIVLSIKITLPRFKEGWDKYKNLKKNSILHLICLFLQNPSATRCGEKVRLKHYDGD